MMTNSPAAATGGLQAGEPSAHPEHRNLAPADEAPRLPITGADKLAYAFYATAATAALAGQVWAGVEHIDWPANFNMFTKIILVAPAVAVIELGGVATAGLADVRRRLGETAYVYRTLSVLAALAAIIFNLVGHWDSQKFLGFGFAGLSAFAYTLWLAHSSARRRDSLRRRRMLSQTAPVYGLVRWITHPRLTWRARSLALEHGLGLYESLSVAREQLETEQRDQGIKDHVSDLILQEQGEQHGPIGAKIAVTTYDMSRVTTMLKDRLDYDGVVDRLSQVLRVGGPAAAAEIEAPAPAPELESAPAAASEGTDPEPTPPPTGGRGTSAHDGEPAIAPNREGGEARVDLTPATESAVDEPAVPAEPAVDEPAVPAEPAVDEPAVPAQPEKVPAGEVAALLAPEADGHDWTRERVFALLDEYQEQGVKITGRLLQAPNGPQLAERTATRRVQEWKKSREAQRRSGLVAVK